MGTNQYLGRRGCHVDVSEGSPLVISDDPHHQSSGTVGNGNHTRGTPRDDHMTCTGNGDLSFCQVNCSQKVKWLTMAIGKGSTCLFHRVVLTINREGNNLNSFRMWLHLSFHLYSLQVKHPQSTIPVPSND